MLVFAVLLDRSGITAAQGGGLQPLAARQHARACVGAGTDTVEEARTDVGVGVHNILSMAV